MGRCYSKDMEMSQIIWTILTSIFTGAVIIIGWSIGLGRRFQILDDLKDGFADISDEIKDLGRRISTMEGLTQGMLKKESPVNLTEAGSILLEDSGWKNIIDLHQKDLIDIMRKDGLNSAYDVQECAKRVVEKIELSPEESKKIKDFAFQKGIDLDQLDLAASIYLRNLALDQLGFKIEDIKD